MKEDWYEFPDGFLRQAREAKGLSRERLAPRVHVTSKTIERYESENRVPRQMLALFIDALDIEVEEPKRERVKLHALPNTEGESTEIRQLRQRVEEQGEVLEEMADELRGVRRLLENLQPG